MTTNANELTPEQIAGMSIEELSALAGDIPSDDDSDTGASQTPADDDKTQAVEGKAEDSADKSDKATEGEPEKKAEDQPAGVATKAGDNIIPYSVLEASRRSEKEALDCRSDAARPGVVHRRPCPGPLVSGARS